MFLFRAILFLFYWCIVCYNQLSCPNIENLCNPKVSVSKRNAGHSYLSFTDCCTESMLSKQIFPGEILDFDSLQSCLLGWDHLLLSLNHILKRWSAHLCWTCQPSHQSPDAEYQNSGWMHKWEANWVTLFYINIELTHRRTDDPQQRAIFICLVSMKICIHYSAFKHKAKISFKRPLVKLFRSTGVITMAVYLIISSFSKTIQMLR